MSLNYVVLVVDDEPSVLMIVRKILERADFDVLTAASAEQAVDVLEKKLVDVILLDVNMPGMDGFEFLEKIKDIKHAGRIPVIMLTSQDEISDFQRGHQLGVEDYLTKPFDSRILVQRVTRAIVYASRPDEFKQGTGSDLLPPTLPKKQPHDPGGGRGSDPV